jgi:hypothetical protein
MKRKRNEERKRNENKKREQRNGEIETEGL